MSRPEHTPKGDPCSSCGLASARHRKRARKRGDYFKGYRKEHAHTRSEKERDGWRQIIGIDGEGYTLPDGSHRYTYLAACDETGLVSDTHNPKGLRASQVFMFLMSLPPKALLVGFSLGYDRTKWVESWPDERIWRLCRPEERLGKNGPLPVDCDGWRVNLVSTRMTLKRKDEPDNARCVWDVWKFFQSSFVKALDGWQIGTPDERALIKKEKARRGAFVDIGERERAYCQIECRLLAVLVRSLIDAHEAEGIRLQSYYGPGSTASVILRELKADEQNAGIPDAMLVPVQTAFFAGRFEPSRVGPVRARRLYSWDLASAYPWAMTLLPCFCSGEWRRVTRRLDYLLKDSSRATLFRFRVDPHPDACPAWGPLPHRLPDGNILFPVQSAGGWAWADEVRAGFVLHPGIKLLEAWTYEPGCDHPPPFDAKIRELYARRLAWGKAVRGRVLRLGLNSLYGKACQKVGKGRFRCMVRAGLITSLTRSRLLEAIARAKDPWAVLELATDSVLSTEDLGLTSATSKELGGWDPKPWKGGAFVVRSGLRFALRPDADIDLTAARGVGVGTLHDNRAVVLAAWKREPMAPVTLRTPDFFYGAKLGVRAGLGPEDDEGRPAIWTRDPMYGRWARDETRTLTFSPRPKREALLTGFRLEPWRLPMGKGCESVPYGSVGQSVIGDELDRMRELEEDQDDKGGLALL